MAETAFIAKLDFAALSGASGLVTKDQSRNASNSITEAKDAHGNIIAHNNFGDRAAPVNNYELSTDLTDLQITLGEVNTVDSAPYLLKQVSFKTAESAPVTASAVTEKLQSGATASSTIDMGTLSLLKLHKAQYIASSVTLGGTGCHLQSNDITYACDVTFALVEGVIKSHDVSAGKITQVMTIKQTGVAIPTVVAGTGWDITENLKETGNPDADYPMWTVTLTKYVASTEPA